MDRGARGRTLSYGVALVFLGAVAYPATWPDGTDSFPFSSFPMFSTPRPAMVSIPTVLGVTSDGMRTTLSPELIGGSPWVNLSAQLLRDTVRRGKAEPGTLCRTVAGRVAAAEASNIATVEVVTETFDSMAYFEGQFKPAKRQVHAVCPVVR